MNVFVGAVCDQPQSQGNHRLGVEHLFRRQTGVVRLAACWIHDLLEAVGEEVHHFQTFDQSLLVGAAANRPWMRQYRWEEEVAIKVAMRVVNLVREVEVIPNLPLEGHHLPRGIQCQELLLELEEMHLIPRRHCLRKEHQVAQVCWERTQTFLQLLEQSLWAQSLWAQSLWFQPL